MNDTVQATAGSPDRGHLLTAVDRREITVRGVSDVISFDETNVRLVTVCGILNLEGEGLRIHVLNTKDGTVAVTGNLVGVLYEEADRPAQTGDSSGARGHFRRFLGK